MSAHAAFTKENETYVANFGDKGSLPISPTKKLLIVTCIDVRLDPSAHLGLKLGEAHIVRNAGGVVADAIRNIVISQHLLGTREIAVFHHTACGIMQASTPKLREFVKAAAPGDEQVAQAVDHIDLHEFSDMEGSVKDDVQWLKAHPLLLKETVVTGWVYEVETGKVRQIV